MLKIKHERTADVVLAGYRLHKTSTPEKPLVGSLLLGLYDDAGSLQFVGVAASFPWPAAPSSSTSWDRSCWTPTAPRRPSTRGPGGRARDGPDARCAVTLERRKGPLVRPLRVETVLEVAYDHMEGSRFRHTVQLRRWRTDREPASCTYEQLEEPVSYELDALLPGRRGVLTSWPSASGRRRAARRPCWAAHAWARPASWGDRTRSPASADITFPSGGYEGTVTGSSGLDVRHTILGFTHGAFAAGCSLPAGIPWARAGGARSRCRGLFTVRRRARIAACVSAAADDRVVGRMEDRVGGRLRQRPGHSGVDPCGLRGNRDLGELQYNDPALVSVENGNLVLRAQASGRDGYQYVAGSVSSKDKLTIGPYGRLTTRQLLGPGAGIGFAVALYGEDIDAVGWPACGEIDATEIALARPGSPFASIHGPGYSGSPISATGNVPSLVDRWAEHTLVWEPTRISWAIDGQVYHVAEASDPRAAGGWPFNQPFFITMVLTIGSTLSGPVDVETWPRDAAGEPIDPTPPWIS
ncbi:family 16 glycosylhydrolase [Oerskovia sp. M15]